MTIFGPDPKDALIQHLQGEIRYLRERMRELESALLAITDPRAHAVLHRPAPQPPGPEVPHKPQSPGEYAGTMYRPALRPVDVERLFGDSPVMRDEEP